MPCSFLVGAVCGASTHRIMVYPAELCHLRLHIAHGSSRGEILISYGHHGISPGTGLDDCPSVSCGYNAGSRCQPRGVSTSFREARPHFSCYPRLAPVLHLTRAAWPRLYLPSDRSRHLPRRCIMHSAGTNTHLQTLEKDQQRISRSCSYLGRKLRALRVGNVLVTPHDRR